MITSKDAKIARYVAQEKQREIALHNWQLKQLRLSMPVKKPSTWDKIKRFMGIR